MEKKKKKDFPKLTENSGDVPNYFKWVNFMFLKYLSLLIFSSNQIFDLKEVAFVFFSKLFSSIKIVLMMSVLT